MEHSAVWDRFGDLLPARPYCADYLNEGLLIRARRKALQFRHVQYNDPLRTFWLPFDVDREDAFDAWERGDLPAPNIIVTNPDNGHAHLSWLLKTPVLLKGRPAPIRYAEAVQRGMSRRLEADPGYAGLIAKNPRHDDWRTQWLAPNAYDLADLAGWLTDADMRFRPKTREDMGFLGRNVQVFDGVRQFAYREVRAFRRNGGTVEAFQARLVNVGAGFNSEFSSPLGPREVVAIAKSISKWTWTRFDERRFVAIQSERGARSGQSRQAKAAELQAEIAVYVEHFKATALDHADITPAAILDHALGTPAIGPTISGPTQPPAPLRGLLSDMVRDTSPSTHAIQTAQNPIRVPLAPTPEAIAKEFGISRRTAYRHLAAIRKKDGGEHA